MGGPATPTRAGPAHWASSPQVYEIKDACDHGVKAIARLHDGTVVVGDQAGDILAYDSRTRLLKKRFAGANGSVRCLAVHPTRRALFAAAGLDRHAHVFDSSKRHAPLLTSTYCKQRLTALIWLKDDLDDDVEEFDLDDASDDE